MSLGKTGSGVDHEHDLAVLRSRTAQVFAAVLVIAWLVLPLVLGEYWSTVFVYAGIASIGAIGLNLLTGFTGQVSMGHAVFYGIGAYTAAVFAGRWGIPFPLWLIAASMAGAVVGGLVGPFALRLRGNYLVIVSLGLLVLGQHVFENWVGITGGLIGTPVRAKVGVGSLDVGSLSLGGIRLTRNQGYLYFVWATAALLTLAARNIVRSRPGRAMQAIRDRDLAAEVVGVSLVHYKVGAFIVSSGYAACAGALYASFNRFVSPLDFSLFLSIQFIAMIVVGGIGTVHGSILGAVFLTILPRVIESISGSLPFVNASGTGGGLTVQSLNQALFGLLIIGFLLFEPMGLAQIWRRVRRSLKSQAPSY